MSPKYEISSNFYNYEVIDDCKRVGASITCWSFYYKACFINTYKMHFLWLQLNIILSSLFTEYCLKHFHFVENITYICVDRKCSHQYLCLRAN